MSLSVEKPRDKYKLHRPPPIVLKKLVISDKKSDKSNSPTNMICVSPITDDHWSIRCQNKDIKLLTTAVFSIIQKHRKYIKYYELPPVEFMPNLYLGCFDDLFKLEHHIRVSIMDDYSLLNALKETVNKNLIDKLEIMDYDNGRTDIMKHINDICEFLDKQDSNNIKIIHCYAGMNRSATLATAYYMYKTKTKLVDAIIYMMSLRPIILQNDSFVQQLVIWAYDNNLV